MAINMNYEQETLWLAGILEGVGMAAAKANGGFTREFRVLMGRKGAEALKEKRRKLREFNNLKLFNTGTEG